ncbi:MAG: hypothetical protein M1834_005067 [Cirrosporium novae-zelandiae]|nr:MAG: hypothetical protein M1834_005067 [Cirrosporium novae-zelandiae]
MTVPGWKLAIQKRRAEQAEAIPPEWRLKSIPEFVNANFIIGDCGILTPEEVEITNITDAKVTLSKIASGELSCVTVTTAFCKRAAVAQQLIKCCTEIFFDRALARAKELDEHFAKTGKTVGPLHGLPMSFKDSQNIKGIDSTIGWAGLIGKPAQENTEGVEIAFSLGAIVYVKTNIPQSLMMSDSYNHVWGQSVNAFNKNLISGGSSGGEGALLGARGSLVGIGTDIGGSVRIPAVLQGLYGLCPTVGRVPNPESCKVQQYLVPPVTGPLTNTISSLETYMEALTESEPWKLDAHLIPIPWRKDLTLPPERKLKIAFLVDDGILKPQPPVERTTLEMMEKFRNHGHEVIEWDPLSDSTSHPKGYDIWLKCILADGGVKCRRYCNFVSPAEPLIEGMLVGTASDLLSTQERQEAHDIKTRYQLAYLKAWTASGIDALIMPVQPWVAFPPKAWVRSKHKCSYTAIWNLLDYTALTIPASKVDPTLDQIGEEWKAYEGKYRSESDEFIYKQYDVELVKNMPVGLQVVTGRFGEEKAVGIAKLIESFGIKGESEKVMNGNELKN